MERGELFQRCRQLAEAEPSVSALRYMHETLVLCCRAGTQGTGQGYGGLFAQVDYVCKHGRMSAADRAAAQVMRYHANQSQPPVDRQDWLYDVRALALLVAAATGDDVPDWLRGLLPATNRPADKSRQVNLRYVRCIVDEWDDNRIYVSTGDDSLVVDYSAAGYLRPMLREGMQLNLLDCHAADGCVTPGLIVVEPDFLIDISSLARCFCGYGHHPLLYTAARLRPRGNSQAMLLGNVAGMLLDDTLSDTSYSVNDTLRTAFRSMAMQFCTCEDFVSSQFVDDSRLQATNIAEAAALLFADYDRQRVLLEPSFVCERLGLQGRVDLMTSDMRLLVEQKSGKNYHITQSRLHNEEHYVQLLLYYGVLRYNFGHSEDKTDIRLLYSRYPAQQGLIYVSFYRELFAEAIRLRNQIVAGEYFMARQGAGRMMARLTPDVVFAEARKDNFYHRYIEPPIASLNVQMTALNATERAYYDQMLTFVYREQLAQKVGTGETPGSTGGAAADLWNLPLAEKREQGNIYTGLTITRCSKAAGQHGYNLIELESGDEADEAMMNFRRGDMVWLYAYRDQPDVRQAILYKGTLQELGGGRLLVRLNNGQQHEDAFVHDGFWAVEHAGSDQNTTSAIKGLHQLATADPYRRALLLGLRSPEADTTRRLTRSYHPDYDAMLLKAVQARDYFLLVGPPGTGKTSMALRFLVEENLVEGASLLLMAYTNRAVDEICAMLTDAGHDYLRLGSDASCDPRFHSHLLDMALSETSQLDDLRQQIVGTPIIVGTTSMLQARPYIFQLKHFSLAIVDEASQILEPNIVGLLALPQIDRFILIGDHKQLPAVVVQGPHESLVGNPLLTAIGITDCRRSLFERLMGWERSQGRTDFIAILRKQGRMHPDVAAFSNEMFYSREQLLPVPLEHQTDTSLHYDLPAEDPLDTLLQTRRVVFFDVPASLADVPLDASDKVNAAEAQLVARLLRRIYRFHGERFDAAKTVGVIVPYRNQIAMIRHELAALDVPQLLDVSIDTVERYQGSQRDVIVYSFTVSRPYQLDFLTSSCFTDDDGRTIDRRLNVALTRARKQLLMTGNAKILSRNEIFAQLIARYSK